MTPAEQLAFVKAYGKNIAHHPSHRVADIVASYVAGEDIDYSFEYTSIMDALCMWHDAKEWKLEQLSGREP